MSLSQRLVPTPRRRVVLDNDWSGDPDGVLALAHHLLSPANRIDAITGSFLNPEFGAPPTSAADGAAMARELIGLMGHHIDVHPGSETPWAPGSQSSAAGAAIVAQARREDPLPLLIVCGGPLTNVAAALEADPGVAERATLVWIGGALEESRYEYNRDTDPAAAERVLAQPGLVIHEFPVEAYRQCAYSLTELDALLTGAGRVGAWLRDHFASPPDWVELDEFWPLGDSPPLFLTALTTQSCEFDALPADGGAERTVYTRLDTRLLFGDMEAKFARLR